MEKSYHAAKAAMQGHTQHGGTAARTSVIVQQYEWWYRCIQHRYTRKEQKKLVEMRAAPVDVIAISAAAKRRTAWWASSAPAASEEWRSSRQRDRKHWVVGDTDSTEDVDMEEDTPRNADVPGGSSNGAVDTQSTQEGTSQDTTGSELEYDHVTDITQF